jgi:hypothetical protein
VSQASLGDALGIIFEQTKYELGANRISASVLVKGAALFGVSAADLLPRINLTNCIRPHHRQAAEARTLLEVIAAIMITRGCRAVLALVLRYGRSMSSETLRRASSCTAIAGQGERSLLLRSCGRALSQTAPRLGNYAQPIVTHRLAPLSGPRLLRV